MYNFFKNLLGIPDTDKHDRSSNTDNFRRNAYRNRDGDEISEDFSNVVDPPDSMYRGYSVFTDPLEMHRYFEQQMDEMMKSFQGLFRADEGSLFGFEGFDRFLMPGQPEYPEIEPPRENLRDHYLKPGYERVKERDVGKQQDTDLDGNFDLGSLDSILKEQKSTQTLTPYQSPVKPQTSYFGKSMTSRTIQRSDGSIETHHTTQDHEGNVETTVTKQIGDKQYSVTTRKNKHGEEEKIENIINMDEKDISQFLQTWQEPQQPIKEDPNKYFPFDKFFK